MNNIIIVGVLAMLAAQSGPSPNGVAGGWSIDRNVVDAVVYAEITAVGKATPAGTVRLTMTVRSTLTGAYDPAASPVVQANMSLAGVDERSPAYPRKGTFVVARLRAHFVPRSRSVVRSEPDGRHRKAGRAGDDPGDSVRRPEGRGDYRATSATPDCGPAGALGSCPRGTPGRARQSEGPQGRGSARTHRNALATADESGKCQADTARKETHRCGSIANTEGKGLTVAGSAA